MVVYIGDSANLAFLQIVRNYVESVAGQSSFTQDPSKVLFREAPPTVFSHTVVHSLLPAREEADLLVSFYFTNVSPPFSCLRANILDPARMLMLADKRPD